MCFTDSPKFSQRILNCFPNFYIGITGETNHRRDHLLLQHRHLHDRVQHAARSSAPQRLCVVPETDAPYMVPAPIYYYAGPAFAAPDAEGKSS
ncbi:hypothetical protein B0H17DRAFT_1327789 [Mycena rosella]|uniref:Uncharacterized protein n=1 Tax=Mycena rosella TaxID=1033263 RepID=A0AAD7DVH0_MYCRO|nr:hypothetical protein B0H17DRAFT_1327789 [Mycena rosella]